MYSIILPTYNNPEYLELCINSIIENSYYKTHQLCIHVNGYNKETVDYLESKNIKYTISQENIGLPKACKICVNNSVYNKLLYISDDFYFSKNWDYNLHKWEIELEKEYPDYVHLIGYKYCEPYTGSFLPICDAGKNINSFNVNKFNEYIEKHSKHEAQGWLTNSLYPKDLILKLKPSEEFEYNLCDIDLILEILKHFKENNIKYLMFSAKDVCVYHFGSVASKKANQRYLNEKLNLLLVKKFEDKWNMTVDSAYHKVLDPECVRSIKMVNNMIENNKNINESETITYCMMGFNSLYEIKPYLETITSYINRFIYIDGGSSDGTLEYLQSINKRNGNSKIEIYTHKWKDNFPEQRNNYLKHFAEKQNEGWILVSDTDEHFTLETLQNIRNIINEASLNNFNGIKFLAYDIIVDDNDNTKIVDEHVSNSNFHKPLMFKYDNTIKYTGSAHETITGQIRWMVTDFKYQHIRSHKKIMERAIQNFWIYSMILKLPRWKEFRELCLSFNIKKFKDFFKLYTSNSLPKNLVKWFESKKNYKMSSNELELLELRDMSNYYFELNNKKMNTKQPTISTYITTRNSLFFQSTIEQTIRQSILFSDEVVVSLSSKSTDGTLNLLNILQSEYPDKLKIYIDKDDVEKSNADQDMLKNRKDKSLKMCISDYCILQDDDECIHEKYIETIKQLPINYPNALAFRFNTIHFYRSYNHYQNTEGWYPRKIYMVKNLSNIHHGRVGTDPDNHVIETLDYGKLKLISLDSLPNNQIINTDVTVYHYGWVRNDSTLLIKKYLQEIRWWGKEYWKTHEFPLKFDNPNDLPKFEGTHPKYMNSIIETQKKVNTMHIKDFEKESSKNCGNKIKISVCIITRNESERIKDTILHVYPYVDEIIVNDASDDDKTKKECLYTDHHYKVKYFKTEKTNNFAEERNKMHNWATGDYCLHIDTDERFPIEFLTDAKNIIQTHLDKNVLPLMFRFSRSNIELDINKDPDYQIRLMNRQYSRWERPVHEIPYVVKYNEYKFHNETMKVVNLVPTNYIIEHLSKDRVDIRKRWDVISNNSNRNINKKMLICSMFKNSNKWLNDILLCIDNFVDYNNNVSNNNKMLINFAFLISNNEEGDNTNEMLYNYTKLRQFNINILKYNSENTNLSRYQKLALLRNYIITESTKDKINLNDDDLILFMDSDVKFDKNIVHELIIDMNKCDADIIAPLVCVEDNGAFKDNYFYDTLAFINKQNEQFSHFKPYIFGDIKKSKIKEEKHKKVQMALSKIDELNRLRKINWEFNIHNPLNDTFPDNLYKEAFSLIDLNIPIEVHSVGSFYLMKYKVAKNIKYTGINDSEQVEFMNSARSKGYKIFVSQRLKVLHVNLEKYGLKWH